MKLNTYLTVLFVLSMTALALISYEYKQTKIQRDKLASIVLWRMAESRDVEAEINDFLVAIQIDYNDLGEWSYCY